MKKGFIWIGEYFGVKYGENILIDKTETIISKSLIKTIVITTCMRRQINIPKRLPQFMIQIEGNEDINFMNFLGDSQFIPNDSKVEKDALDSRDPLFYSSLYKFDLSFIAEHRVQIPVFKPEEITIMDTNKELFIFVGNLVRKDDRAKKCLAMIRDIFERKQKKDKMDKVVISFVSMKHKIYSAMKFYNV